MTEIGTGNPDYPISMPGREGSVVRLAWSASTDIGKRRAANEDSYVAKSPLFAVADGMGGHSAGDLASAAVVERLAEILTGDFLTPQRITTALEHATADITEISADSVLGVGTTVTGIALTLQDATPYFAVFNIGDSRVYCFDHDGLFQVTVDHSVVQELVEAGAITKAEAEHHPDSNVITRAVGFSVKPVPDVWMVELSAGLRFLVCSDGLTKEVSDESIRMHLAAGLTPEATSGALIDAALASGGRDNVTAIVVDVLEVPETGEIDDTQPRGKRS